MSNSCFIYIICKLFSVLICLQNIQNYKNSTNESTFSNGWENDFEWDSIDSNDENSCAKSTVNYIIFI